MFSSSPSGGVGRTAAPLPLMGCCVVAIVMLRGRVLLAHLRRDDTRLVVLATADVRQKVVKAGGPISDNEALAPQWPDRGFVISRGHFRSRQARQKVSYETGKSNV